MVRYEYRVVSLKAYQIAHPEKATTAADGALALFEQILNENAAEGWEFFQYVPEIRERVSSIEWDAIVFRRPAE